eukprot:5594405-Ditylum_brightwellii.AAC.1
MAVIIGADIASWADVTNVPWEVILFRHSVAMTSSNAILNSLPFFVLAYNAAISASELDAMMPRITSHTECTSLLSRMCFVGGLVGSFGLDKRGKWPSALLRAHGSDI